MMMQHGGGSNIDGTYWRNASPVVKKGARPWNYISQTKAIKVSESLVNTASANSTLINSYMWDTTLNYITKETSKNTTTDSTDWGNYYNANFTVTDASYSTDLSTYTKVNSSTKSSGATWLLTSGATTDRNVARNIHDLAGNLLDWTTEKVNGSGSASMRGGCCNKNGILYPAASRNYNGVANISDYIGFRSALYLL